MSLQSYAASHYAERVILTQSWFAVIVAQSHQSISKLKSWSSDASMHAVLVTSMKTVQFWSKHIPKLYVDLSLLHGKDFSTAVGRISSGVLAYCLTILAFKGLNPGRLASWFKSELLFSLCEDVGLTSLYPADNIIIASCREYRLVCGATWRLPEGKKTTIKHKEYQTSKNE